MSKKRLPLVTLWVDFAGNFRSFFIFAIFIYLKFFKNWQSLLPILGFVILFLGLTFLPAFLKYRHFYYSLTPTALFIEQGVFNQRKLTIPYNRMQALKKSQWFFMKPFHLVSLTIETAGNTHDEAEVRLSAVPIGLVTEISARKDSPEGAILPEKEHVLSPEKQATYRIALSQIFLFSLTDLSLIFTTVILVFGFSNRLQGTIWKALKEMGSWAQGSFLIALSLFLAGALLFALLSIAKGLYRYYDFTVSRHKQQLRVEQGLFSRSELRIPVKKIQGLEVRQSLLRKLFHLSSVKLLLATGSSESEKESLYLLPIVKEQELHLLLNKLLPEWNFEKRNFQQDNQPYWRYFLRLPALLGLILIPLLQHFFWWGGILAFLVVLYFLGTKIWSAKIQGFSFLSDNLLLVEALDGTTKVRSYVLKNKVQDFSVDTSYWRFKKEIGDFSLSLKTGDSRTHLVLEYFPLRFQKSLKNWLLR